MTANQCTVLLIILGIIGGIVLSAGNYWTNLVAGILFQVSYLLDTVDGEIARYRNSCSSQGVLLDYVGHHLIDAALFAGLSFSAFSRSGSPYVFAFGFVGCACTVLLYDLGVIRAQMISHSRQDRPREQSESRGESGHITGHYTFLQVIMRQVATGVRRFAWIWASPGLFGLTLLGALIDRIVWVLVFYGVSAPLFAVAVAYRQFKRLQDREKQEFEIGDVLAVGG